MRALLPDDALNQGPRDNEVHRGMGEVAKLPPREFSDRTLATRRSQSQSAALTTASTRPSCSSVRGRFVTATAAARPSPVTARGR